MDDKARSKSWPADAGKYPLNASKKGPVYSPPAQSATLGSLLVLTVQTVLLGLVAGFALFAAYAVFEYFFIPG